MERVEGIGGFFFTSDDPESLATWYADHLGVSPTPRSPEDTVWTQQAGPTVFAPSEAEGDGAVLGKAGWGINFRVRDLDAMVGQLRSADIEVAVDSEDYPIGRFAQLHDPEGNAVQLWEPAEKGSAT